MKNILLFLCVFALGNMTLFAQKVGRSRIVQVTPSSAPHVPPEAISEALTNIFTDLSSPKTDLYDGNGGEEIQGPNAPGNFAIFEAMPFTPKSNCHVSQVRVAIGYIGSSPNQVNLSIYDDSSDAPGKLLAGPVTVTDMPEFGTCCTLEVASFSPLALSGGTRYWIVADTPATGTGSEFQGAWNFVVQGKVPAFSAQEDGEWFLQPGKEELAGEVLGTIP